MSVRGRPKKAVTDEVKPHKPGTACASESLLNGNHRKKQKSSNVGAGSTTLASVMASSVTHTSLKVIVTDLRTAGSQH